MKRNKSNRLIAILCAVVMFAEQIWGSGLYVNAAGETDAKTVSEAQQDQAEETDAEAAASEESSPEVTAEDATPVTDQDNAEDTTAVNDQETASEEASAEGDTEEEVAVEADDTEVSEEKYNDTVYIEGIGKVVDGKLIVGVTDENNKYNVSVPGKSVADIAGEDVRDSITSIEFDANAKMSVMPYGFMMSAKNLESVDMTNAKALQEIDLYAFAGCKKLKSVKLGTVTTVKPYVFKECTELPEIDLATVAKIGSDVFDGCSKLTKVILRKNLSCETFTYYAGQVPYQSCFVGCSVNQIVFEDGMSVVPGKLFMGKQNVLQRHVFDDNAVIEIPYTVNDIGESAFSMSNIKKVVIKHGDDGEESLLRGISVKAFYQCEDLVDLRGDENEYAGETIHFPKGIQKIEDSAFDGCKAITRVFLPSTITTLGKRAFAGCENLNDLTLSTNTDRETTKEEVFMSCTKLQSVVIPDGLKALGVKEFYECYALETVTFEGKTLKYIGDYAFGTQNDQAANYVPAKANKITAADMPDSITELGKGVFANCICLKTAHVPQTLKVIPDNLFQNCFVLTTADMPNIVEKIGNKAFCKCESLVLNNEEEHLASKNLLPTMLTEIGDNAFNQCEQFPYIIIPEKVTTLGAGAFGHCFNAEYIKFETKVLEKCTGANIFDNNVSVKEVIFPAGITSIPANLFWGAQLNTNTCHIVIPKTVTEIGQNAFSGESINRKSTIRYISFEEGSAIQTIGINAFRYNSTMEEIILPEGLQEIKDGAFANSDNLKGIIIPESVTFIGVNAFAEGKLLAKVEIRAIDFTTNVNLSKQTDTSRFITTCIFYNSNIRTIIIGSKVASFPDYLFLGAKFSDSDDGSVTEADLITLNIPKSVKSLGDYCLPNVVNLKEVSIEADSELERIGRYAFLDCKNLVAINIPDGVTEIGAYAFSGCKRLGVDSTEEFKLPSKLELLGKGAFERCAKLGKTVTLPAGLTTVDDEIFKNCESLEGVTFLCSVTDIGASAFEGCTALVEVFIPYGVENIGVDAFKNCTALTKVVLPNTIASIGSGAFDGCDNAVFYLTAGSKAIALLKAAGIPDTRIHVYAYKITYELYEGTNDPQNPSGFDTADQPIELKPATRAGSTFMGWFEDEAFTKEVKTIMGRSADVTLYAKWITEEYPITYILRGGTNDPDNPSSYTMWTEDITLKAPTLKGASFQGWYTDLSDATSKVTVIKKGSSGALTLYAKWNGKSTAKPTANITSGAKVPKGSVLRLYCTTPGAVVYYNVSYEDALPASPEAIPANEYKGGIVIEKRVKVRAMAVADGYLESEPADFEFDILDENSYWGDVVDKEDQQMWNNPASVPANIWVAGVPEEVDYTGEAITFNHIRVYDHKTLLTEGVDYTISYKNNKKIADKAASKAPTVVVKGKGSYSGTYPHYFTIKSGKMVISGGGTAIKKADVVIKNPIVNYEYFGDYSAALGITVTTGGKLLVENTDYIVVYGKNKAGTVKATVKGVGSYKGKVSKKFTVKPADISKALVCFVDDSGNEVSANSTEKYVPTVSYQKGGATPKVQVYIGERRLINGVDYTVEYAGNTPGRNATSNGNLKIVGKGNYSGAAGGIGFTVVKGAMSDIAIGASGVKFNEKGISAKDIKVVAIDTNGKLLSKLDDAGKPLDYTVKCTYVQNGEVVELTDAKVQLAPDTPINVTITGENNYSGSVSTTCTVYTATIDKAKVKVNAQEYSGLPKEPGYDAISVTVKGTPLGKNEYSIVGYISNVKKGNAKVYLAGYGSYGGLKAVKFKIKAKKMVK